MGIHVAKPYTASAPAVTPRFTQRNVLIAKSAAGNDIPILYGGSVKSENASNIFAVPQVGGALVGGASLISQDFLEIIKAGQRND